MLPDLFLSSFRKDEYQKRQRFDGLSRDKLEVLVNPYLQPINPPSGLQVGPMGIQKPIDLESVRAGTLGEYHSQPYSVCGPVWKSPATASSYRIRWQRNWKGEGGALIQIMKKLRYPRLPNP